MQAPNFAVTIVSAPRRFSECLICWTNIQVFSQLLCWLWPGICPPGIHFQVILHVYIILFSTEGTLNMWYFAQFGKPAILLKVTILHGCFSRFLNFTNGTKSPAKHHIWFFLATFFLVVILASFLFFSYFFVWVFSRKFVFSTVQQGKGQATSNSSVPFLLASLALRN